MKKYQQPLTADVKLFLAESFLAGSVRNDDKKIMEGSTNYEENPEGNGDDAGAKPYFFTNLWSD